MILVLTFLCDLSVLCGELVFGYGYTVIRVWLLKTLLA